jgi:hypothetical protein
MTCKTYNNARKGNKFGVESIEPPLSADRGPLPNYNPFSMSARVTSFLFKYLSLAVIITAAALSVTAQKPKPSPTPLPEDPQGTVKVAIRRVRLPITVTDKKGQFVPGLTQRDFVILEDKVPQAIETFSDDLSQTTPLYIAVLMDTSPSTAGKLKFQQESAMNFIQTVVKPRKDRVLFATFDDQINLLQDFTDRLDLLDKAVYGVKKMGTQTALFDAIWQFCDEKMRSVPGRRVLLVVTDGEDTYSRANIRDAIDIAQRTASKQDRSPTRKTKICKRSRKKPVALRSSPATCCRSSDRSRGSRKSYARSISSLTIRRTRVTTARSERSM